ncbi:two-component sensor histidine kinase, partial [Romeria aff. gracilis LEGE 07310]
MRKKLESGSKDSIFSGLRWQLLGYQLSVMATILALAGLGVYLFFWRSLYRQLDDKLLTLAQSATLAVGEVEAAGEVYLNQLDEVPWRDIFNRDRQSLEWFDAQGELLAKRGSISLSAPPQVGSATLQAAQPIRTLTIAVFEDDPDAPTKAFRGYVRASQSTQDLRETQEQLQQGLLLGGSLALG